MHTPVVSALERAVFSMCVRRSHTTCLTLGRKLGSWCGERDVDI